MVNLLTWLNIYISYIENNKKIAIWVTNKTSVSALIYHCSGGTGSKKKKKIDKKVKDEKFAKWLMSYLQLISGCTCEI